MNPSHDVSGREPRAGSLGGGRPQALPTFHWRSIGVGGALLAALVLGVGCGKKGPPTGPGGESLDCSLDPRGMISAKVNGATWSAAICGAAHRGPGDPLLVQGETRDARDHQQTVLDLHLLGVTGPGTYDLTPGALELPIASYCDQALRSGADADGDCGFEQAFFTDSLFTGKVTIETLDRSLKLVSGKFGFIAVRSDGAIVTVSDGAFVLHYCDK